MKVLIVAAGRGSRLGVHSDQTPKCLAPFAGSRLLDLQLSVLRGAGLDDIQRGRGYLGEQRDGLGLTLWDNPDWAATNMVASMLCARPVLESGEDVILAYGDIIYEEKILEALLADDSEAGVIVDREWLKLWNLRSEDPLSDAESLRLDGGGNIIDIGRKVPSLDEIEAKYIGLMRFSAKACGELLDLLDRAAGVLELIERRLGVFLDVLIDLVKAEIHRIGDLHALHGLVIQRNTHLGFHRGNVSPFALAHIEDLRCVAHGPADGKTHADISGHLIVTLGEHARAAGLQPNKSTDRRRDADRPAAVTRMRKRHHARSHSSPSAATRATRVARKIPWITSGAQ